MQSLDCAPAREWGEQFWNLPKVLLGCEGALQSLVDYMSSATFVSTSGFILIAFSFFLSLGESFRRSAGLCRAPQNLPVPLVSVGIFPHSSTGARSWESCCCSPSSSPSPWRERGYFTWTGDHPPSLISIALNNAHWFKIPLISVSYSRCATKSQVICKWINVKDVRFFSFKKELLL